MEIEGSQTACHQLTAGGKAVGWAAAVLTQGGPSSNPTKHPQRCHLVPASYQPGAATHLCLLSLSMQPGQGGLVRRRRIGRSLPRLTSQLGTLLARLLRLALGSGLGSL